MKPFGENLEELMHRKRLTIRALAKELGCSHRTVAEWVGSHGRAPRNLAIIKKLSSLFEISVHFLLFGEEDPLGLINEVLNRTELHTGLYEITIKKVGNVK